MRYNEVVGNEFFVAKKSKSRHIQIDVQSAPACSIAVNAFKVTPVSAEFIPVINSRSRKSLGKIIDYLQIHSLGVFTLMILAIALVSQPIVASYWTKHELAKIKTAPTINLKSIKTVPGINLTVTSSKFQTWMQNYLGQSATINLGSYTVNIDPSILKSWLQITANASKTDYFIHIKGATIPTSIEDYAKSFEKSPRDQVVAIRDDGSSEIAVGGRNGLQLSKPSTISNQTQDLAKNLFSNKGFNINAPLVSVPFQSTTPAAFNKLIVADTNSKKMYVYENGQIVKTYLISAGAPSTPTPIGEFHIYSKLTVQDMKGFNLNGTPYFQPHVHWINYFSGADAIHGVYWHPLDWFGVHNSSHGCVGLTEENAQWIFDWAPIGTTVITTLN